MKKRWWMQFEGHMSRFFLVSKGSRFSTGVNCEPHNSVLHISMCYLFPLTLVQSPYQGTLGYSHGTWPSG